MRVVYTGMNIVPTVSRDEDVTVSRDEPEGCTASRDEDRRRGEGAPGCVPAGAERAHGVRLCSSLDSHSHSFTFIHVSVVSLTNITLCLYCPFSDK